MKMHTAIHRVTMGLVLLTLGAGCAQRPDRPETSYEERVHERAQSFFHTFAERSDWDEFCSYYREDMKFSDVILQLDLDGLWQFKRFYKWDEEGDLFQKLSPEQEHLSLDSLVVEGNTAVGRGRVNPFYYDGRLIDTDWGMEFTIWLYFDEDLKIIEQHDWFEYDPGTLERMLERVRTRGFEATPDWLDLTPEDQVSRLHSITAPGPYGNHERSS